jgi:hypothetical protein
MLKQELHPQANPQHRLRELRQQGGYPRVTQALHGIRRGADTWKNNSPGRGDLSRIRGHMRTRAKSLERELQRRQVGAATVDDHCL